MAEIPSAEWSWIHGIAERFEQAWKKEPRPRIEDFVADADAVRRPALLEELLQVERELRRRAGEEPSAPEYSARFPEHQAVVAAVFDAGAAGTVGARGLTHSPQKPGDPIPPELANHPDYEIIRELGRGGMGIVYLAKNLIMARDEVLKVMGQHIVEQPGVLDRFLREIRAVAKLRHPNIVSAYTAFRCGESFVFAMEHVVGLDLAQMVKAKGAIAVRQACYYVHQAALGLQYAHEEGMVHRDIKPANLMLSHQRDRAVIKLLDFGLAKATSEQNASEFGIAMAMDSYDFGEHLTCTGDMLGTPDFIAPEQIVDSQQADIRADIYSLGCTLYYLLSGQAPFPNLSLREVLKAQQTLAAQPLDQIRAEVPGALAAVVAKMMAKDPDSRFQEPAEVAEALTPLFKRASASVASMAPPPPIELAATGLGSVDLLSNWRDTGSATVKPGGFGARGWAAIALGVVFGLVTGWAAMSGVFTRVDPRPEIGSPKYAPNAEYAATAPLPPVAPKDPIASSPAPRVDDEASRSARVRPADHVAASPGVVSIPSASDRRPPSAAPELAKVSHPFRLATNGLGGREFIDPISLKPDWLRGSTTALEWLDNDAFARLATRAAIEYPGLPQSRYVLELEITLNEGGAAEVNIGDHPANHVQVKFEWQKQSKEVECKLEHWIYGMAWWDGEKGRHRFDAGKPISLKLVCGDGRQKVFHEGSEILSVHCWPSDCRVIIASYAANSGVIRRMSVRPFSPRDAADCGWPLPPTELGFDARQSRARLAKLFGKHPALPKKEHSFAVKATASQPVWAGTPMVWIKPGQFEMGTRDPNDKKRHQVRLTKGYWMAQTEVTQGEYQKVMGGNPSRITGSPFLPVDSVSWDQAVAYCRKASEAEHKAGRLPPGYEYRLPTEAEWEYACRAGENGDFSVPEQVVWSWERSEGRPHEVAESEPNAWGLYDMHGNAAEWCLDAWYEYPVASKEVVVDPLHIGPTNPLAPMVVRGGRWWSGTALCTSHWRENVPNAPHGYRGFRIVLGPETRGLNTKN
jgi:serine/threonine protein kinase/formylglycine-generating enzyme required for sulfatase activity